MAIRQPGMFLSQPPMATRPSKPSQPTTVSMESAMTSRETREYFIPSVPMEMPSEMVMVLKITPLPPAASTPAQASRASFDVHVAGGDHAPGGGDADGGFWKSALGGNEADRRSSMARLGARSSFAIGQEPHTGMTVRPLQCLDHGHATGGFRRKELLDPAVEGKGFFHFGGGHHAGEHGDPDLPRAPHNGLVKPRRQREGRPRPRRAAQLLRGEDGSRPQQKPGELAGDPADGRFRGIGAKGHLHDVEAAFQQGLGHGFRLILVVQNDHRNNAVVQDAVQNAGFGHGISLAT
jgi:hypothetical protein